MGVPGGECYFGAFTRSSRSVRAAARLNNAAPRLNATEPAMSAVRSESAPNAGWSQSISVVIT